MSCTSNKVLEHLGSTLIGKNGEVSTTEALKGKSVLGLYFSAHWCPPCKAFTPTLSTKYTELKKAGKDFELVFVSSDRNQKAFDEYHNEMSFMAMPYSNRDGKEELSDLFEVQGIPSLVFVDVATGELITNEGREGISKGDFIEKFPYRPKPFNFHESLGKVLKTKTGTVATSDALKGKSVLGLYFSAHWCPPCRGFTPVLSKKYTELKKTKDFELVFVSSDKDENSFNDYHKEMTFLAMPFANRDGKAELSKHFGVSGIPALVFVEAATGKLINDEGRGAISADTYIQDFPYYPKPVNDIGATLSGINDKKCLILFMEDSSADEQKSLQEMFTKIAEDELGKNEKAQRVEKFFVATSGGPIAQIRGGCKLPVAVKKHEHELKEVEGDNWGCDGCGKSGQGCKKRLRCSQGCDFDFCDECDAKSKEKQDSRAPVLVLLNFSKGGHYYKSDKVSTGAIDKFMQDFADKNLTHAVFNE